MSDLSAVQKALEDMLSGQNTQIKTWGETLLKRLDDAVKSGAVSAETIEKMANRLLHLEQRDALFADMPSRVKASQSLTDYVMKTDFMDRAKGMSSRGSVKIELPEVDIKAAILSTQADAANGFPVLPQQVIVAPPTVPVFWQSLTSFPTTSNAIQVVRTAFTNNADFVAEGAQKPESGNAFDPAMLAVGTVAHWVQASLQVLDDVAALRPIIDGELQSGLSQKIDAAVIGGSGVSPQILGIKGQGQQFNADPAFTTPLDQLIAVVATLLSRGATRIVIGVNPMQIATIMVAKSTTGEYVLNPLVPLLGVWGAVFVPTAAVAMGEYVACSTPSTYIAMRQGIGVEASREDRDNFIKNMVTILAEARLAVVVQRPDLALYGALTSSVTTPATTKAAKA